MIGLNNNSDARSVTWYLTASVAALGASIVGWLGSGQTSLQIVVVVSAAIAAILAFSDAREVWRSGTVIGRAVVLIGVVYWFWIDAVTLAFSAPPFPAVSGHYPYFFNEVPEEIVGLSLVAVNLFTVSAIVGWRYVPVPRGILARLADRIDTANGQLIDAYCLVLALMGIVPLFIIFGGSASDAWDTLYQMRSAEFYEGTDPGLAIHLQYFGIAGGAIAVARIGLHSPGNPLLRYLAVATTVAWVFFGGSRFNLAFVLLPSILLLLLPGDDQRQLVSRKSMLLSVSAIVVVIMLIQGAARTMGMAGYIEEQMDLSIIELVSGGFFGHEHFSALMMAVDLVPERHDYFMDPMFPYFFTHFVPRAWWPDKTYSEAWVYYNDVVTGGGQGNFNVTPSIIGQYYMGWGLLGVAYIGMFFGWMARFVELWFARVDLNRQLLSATICGLFLTFIFLSFRMLYPLYFAFPLFATIAYLLITRRNSKSAQAQGRAPS